MSLTKSSIRQNVWSYLEDNDIAQFPRPVFNRIPNFKVSSIDITHNRVITIHLMNFFPYIWSKLDISIHKNSDIACERAVKLNEFKNAKVIKINPDKPQEVARLRTLEVTCN